VTEDLNKLIEALEIVSDVLRDRHFTIFAFTTGYKCVLGTPGLLGDDLNEPPEGDRGLVSSLELHPLLADAIRDVIKNQQMF